MNYLITTLIIDYYVDINKTNICKKLKLINHNFKNIIDSNILYKRKNNANKLVAVLRDLDMTHNILYQYIEFKCDYKYILNSIYNIGTGTDFTYGVFKKNISEYKNDKLAPFRNIRVYKSLEFKIRMKNSILLSMALDHAEKPYSLAKAREIDDYFW